MKGTDSLISPELFAGFFPSLLSGGRAECRDTVQRLLEDGIPIRVLYTELFQAALYKVGELWERNKISVATEHLATSIIEGLLPLVYPRLFAADHCGKKAVISCVANEYHQIGGKMAADLFELNSWDSFFLGANTPLKDLLELIDGKNPDVVGLSVSVSFNTGELLRVIEEIRRKWDRLPIIVGGQAFRFGGAELFRDYPEVKLIEGLDELESYISTRN
jgi:methanogenic corrinoid protein MtbC1